MLKDLIPSPLILEQYRFLDVLDSTRFNAQERKARLPFRLLMAKMEILSALITGDGIAISENILVDSAGFLEVFSELSQIAAKNKVSLPVRIALRGSPKDIYSAAAVIFAKVGNPEKNENRFKLSAWAHLDDDKFRRLKWADSLVSENHNISNQYILSDEEERKYARQLVNVLSYSNSYLASSSRIVQSRDSTNIFTREIDQIATLDKDKLDAMLSQQKLENSPIVQQPWFGSEAERDAAVQIVEFIKELRKSGEINNRTVVHDNLENIKDKDLKEGIIEITDSIYNFALGYATLANASGDTVHHIEDPSNPYVLAGNSLSRWAMETSWHSTGYDIQLPWGIYIPGQVGWRKELNDQEILSFLENMPWDACLAAFKNPRWQASLAEYKYAIAQMQTIDRVIASDIDFSEDIVKKWEKRRDDAFEFMKETWVEHFALSKELISNELWKIVNHGAVVELGAIGDLVIAVAEPRTKISPDAFKRIAKLLLNHMIKNKMDKIVSSVVTQIEDASKPQILEFR